MVYFGQHLNLSLEDMVNVNTARFFMACHLWGFSTEQALQILTVLQLKDFRGLCQLVFTNEFSHEFMDLLKKVGYTPSEEFSDVSVENYREVWNAMMVAHMCNVPPANLVGDLYMTRLPRDSWEYDVWAVVQSHVLSSDAEKKIWEAVCRGFDCSHLGLEKPDTRPAAARRASPLPTARVIDTNPTN